MATECLQVSLAQEIPFLATFRLIPVKILGSDYQQFCICEAFDCKPFIQCNSLIYSLQFITKQNQSDTQLSAQSEIILAQVWRVNSKDTNRQITIKLFHDFEIKFPTEPLGKYSLSVDRRIVGTHIGRRQKGLARSHDRTTNVLHLGLSDAAVHLDGRDTKISVSPARQETNDRLTQSHTFQRKITAMSYLRAEVKQDLDNIVRF